jgi:hypothetical protein
MAEALARAGGAFLKDGEPAKAANRFLRAGRSAQLQSMTEEAEEWLSMSAELASRAGDRETEREALQRLSRIRAEADR